MLTPVQSARFVPRIRFLGVLHWICPYSGHFNRTHLSPWDYRLICGGAGRKDVAGDPGRGCSRRMVPGIHLLSIPSGHRHSSPPPDWIIPDKFIPPDMPDGVEQWTASGMMEAFPTGDLGIVPWYPGTPTHLLVDPRSADFSVDLMVRMVRRIAQAARGDDLEGLRGVRGRVESVGDLARIGAAFELVAQGYGFGNSES